MKISMIAAVANGNALGMNNDLLVKDKADAKFFQQTTMGSILITGRKTFASMGHRPLKGRTTIVITSDPAGLMQEHPGRYFAVVTKEAALDIAHRMNIESVFIIGGSTIYNMFRDDWETFWLTEFQKEVPGIPDTFLDMEMLKTVPEGMGIKSEIYCQLGGEQPAIVSLHNRFKLEEQTNFKGIK